MCIEPHNNEGFVVSGARYLLKNPTFALSLLYLILTTLGIVYLYYLYKQFGIEFFEYAEPTEFILAAFKELRSFQMLLLAIIIISILWYILHDLAKVKPQSPKYKAAIIIYLIFFIFYMFFGPYTWANRNAERIYNNKARDKIVTVMLNTRDDETKKLVSKPLVLIGTTGKTAFFYDHSSQSTIIIPIASISVIRVDKNLNENQENGISQLYNLCR